MSVTSKDGIFVFLKSWVSEIWKNPKIGFFGLQTFTVTLIWFHDWTKSSKQEPIFLNFLLQKSQAGG